MRFASRKDAKLKDNFYVRNDGTRAYYFLKEEIKEMFEKEGFIEIENEYIHRLIENKRENLQMKRIWIQAKFIKKGKLENISDNNKEELLEKDKV